MRRSLLALLLSARRVPRAERQRVLDRPRWLEPYWRRAAPGLNGHVTALHRVGTELYLGGNFTNAGGIAAADRIAKWDGVNWHALGTTPLGNGSVFAIAHYGGKIYAGGTFVNAGGKDGSRLPCGLRRRELEAVLQRDREARLRLRGAPGACAPGDRDDALRRRHLPERQWLTSVPTT